MIIKWFFVIETRPLCHVENGGEEQNGGDSGAQAAHDIKSRLSVRLPKRNGERRRGREGERKERDAEEKVGKGKEERRVNAGEHQEGGRKDG